MAESVAKKAKVDGGNIVLAVISPSTGSVIEALPVAKYAGKVDFVVANDIATFEASGKLDKVTGLVFVAAGGDITLMPKLWPLIPACKWVHSFFAGVDALAPFIKGHLLEGPGAGIPLSNGKGAFSDSLAEWVMTCILHFNKQIPRVIQNKAEKKWDKFVMDTVAGKTLGVVGFGHIGQCTAKMAKQAFNMKVVAVRSNADRKSEWADEVLGPEDKLKCFAESDFVVCALPGTPATKDYCGAPEFAAMKSSAVFISIGRGLAVDEDALAEALKSSSIKAAAVDVFKKEPLVEASPLWDCDNCMITSHNADFTPDYFECGWRIFGMNLDQFLAGEPVTATAISKASGY